MLLTILLVPFIDNRTVFNSIYKVTKVADCIMHMLMYKILVYKQRIFTNNLQLFELK